MAVGDFTSEKGLKDLDTFLVDRSYMSGFVPTNADVQTFLAFKKPPSANHLHVLRWYNHIKSFSDAECKSFGAGSCPLTSGATTTIQQGVSKPANKEDDDDIDLFGSDDEEDVEAAKIREERLKAYAQKKSNKPVLIAKSSIVLDVKPWDDETDMKNMEMQVRGIQMEGLVWGASKLVPVGYGINKLQIICIVEDDKVSVDLLTEKIQDFEDFVQSVDIAAFNKI